VHHLYLVPAQEEGGYIGPGYRVIDMCAEKLRPRKWDIFVFDVPLPKNIELLQQFGTDTLLYGVLRN
jgi:hypothetical protein